MKKAPGENYSLKELDKNSFIAAVYNRYGKKLYSYAIKTWNLNEDSAWDMIYKTIYKVAEVHQKYEFENEEKFASFIFKIFINYLRNHYRDNKSERTFMLAEVDAADINEKTSDVPENSNKKLTALNEVLDVMEDWERMLLLMRSEGRAYSEIATYIDKPENQLKVYYQRLKEQISKKLNERF